MYDDNEVDAVLDAIERQSRIIRPVRCQNRGAIRPGFQTQAEIDALPADYWPQSGAQQVMMKANGKRKRTGWTRFILRVRRLVERDA